MSRTSPTDSTVGPSGDRLNAGAPYRRAIVFANPISGSHQGAKAARELAEGLQRLGVPAEIHLTRAKGDAWRTLRSVGADVDLVVAVGGDGTVREVVSGLVDPEIPIGILPMGTGNVLASELSLPRDVHAAVEILANRKQARLDVFQANGHLCCFVAGVGFDAMAVRAAESTRKGPITKLHYVEAVLRAMRDYHPPVLSVEIDGELVAGTVGFVLVSNAVGYGGVFRLSEEARLDDGQLEVYLFPSGKPLELVGAALRGVVSQVAGGACKMVRARRIAVRSPEPVPFQVDGDLKGETPVEIELTGVQYRIVVP